ncbi:type VI secretion protein IcmF/TssM N-terminal domain-containing protein [Haliangium sp.]|uniref:type VI secretion protein IcmF/TssM N-terminal domain-containing protein n=1 Tax=Haliangium sp. TaxID=2663208 RepID=UPI003D12E5EE
MQDAGQSSSDAASVAAPVAAPASAPVSAASSVPWQTILIVAIIVVVVALLVVLFLWWRRRRKQAPPADPGPSLGHRLESVWRPFYRELPHHARYYPTVVVMGEAGAGKSVAIDAGVGWRGQASEYLPSRTDSGLLQLYAGPGVLAQELSAPLLYDTSRDARRALGKMWRRLRHAPVTAVVVLDASTLTTMTPDAASELAHLIRGKLALLQRRSRHTPDIRLCLTHLDQVIGYADLAQLLRESGGRLDRPPEDQPNATDEQRLARLLAPFEGYLSLALTRRVPDVFARVVGFYRRAPELMSRLLPLLRTLAGDDPFAARYRIEGLYFGGLRAEQRIGDPFAVDRVSVLDSLAAARRRVRLACGLAMGVFGLLLALLFGWHDSRIGDAEAAVAGLEDVAARYRPTPNAAAVEGLAGAVDAAQTRTREALEGVKRSEILWLPLTFQARKADTRRRFVTALRAAHVLPRVVKPVDRPALIYAVALLYAARDNSLGALIRPAAGDWGQLLDLPVRAVDDYVAYSDQPFSEPVTLPSPLPAGGDAPVAWRRFLSSLSRALKQRVLVPDELERLQDSLPALAPVDRYDLLARTVAVMAEEESLPVRVAPLLNDLQPVSRWAEANHATLESLRAMVRGARIEVPDVTGWHLTRLATGLSGLAGEPRPAPETYELTLLDHDYSFSTDAWTDLILRSRAELMVTNFRRDVMHSGRSPFFPGAGRGGLGLALADEADLYTEQAFSEYVAPALRAFGQLEGVPLDEEGQRSLARYLEASVDDYVDAYRRELDAYYQSYRFAAGSLDELYFELDEMVQPSSGFLEFLRTVRDRASLPLEDGALFARVGSGLALYQPVVAVTAEKDGEMPGLAPYLEIISGVVALLEEGTAGEESGLELMPPGALALATLQGTEKDRRAQVTGWLDASKIDRSLRRPFSEPMGVLYRRGYDDIEAAVVRTWENELKPQVTPLFGRFPFARDADEEVDPAQLEALLQRGKGSFWQDFDATVAVACVYDQRNTRWRFRPELDPPRGMLGLVNDLWRLSQTLWDQDGNPQPLAIPITPVPLPIDEVDGRLATVAFLNAGASSVYGFNQKPERQTLSLRWWEQGIASVGVRMEAPDATGQVRHRAIEVSDSAWSFYTLLTRSDSLVRRRASWHVPVISGEDGSLTVSFAFSSDPWALFEVQRPR